MANQWLTGSGVPSTGIGQVTDYYRDTVSNLVYYRENAFTWVVVPAFTPNPDGIGTTWLHGNVPPLTGQGSDGDYFYEDTHKIVYRKEGSTWVAKGSLDFIGIYGVQWGNGIGAPASTVPLNALPAGSFYLNVETSDIYYKEPSMAWVLKGQLGGGGGGGGSIDLVTTLAAVTETDVTSAVTPSVIFDLQSETSDTYATIASPAFTGTPTAPTAAANTNNTELATTAYADGAAATAQSNAEGYADGLVVNLWDDRGTFSAAAGTWPTSGDGGSGVDNSIMKGDTWTISLGGTLTGGKIVAIGDVIRALVNNAGNTSTDWGITENNLGYVAENSTNKATNLTSPDNTKYPTTLAVSDAVAAAKIQSIVVACSDETTALTTGTSKVTFRMPYAFTVSGVRASLSTAQASGSILTVDINDSGTSILSTKLTIDNTEKTSTTAATPPVISDTSLADDAEITIDIDQVGDGTAKGLKVVLIGTRA